MRMGFGIWRFGDFGIGGLGGPSGMDGRWVFRMGSGLFLFGV